MLSIVDLYDGKDPVRSRLRRHVHTPEEVYPAPQVMVQKGEHGRTKHRATWPALDGDCGEAGKASDVSWDETKQS